METKKLTQAQVESKLNEIYNGINIIPYTDEYGRVVIPRVLRFTDLINVIKILIHRIIRNAHGDSDIKIFERIKEIFSFYTYNGKSVTIGFYIWTNESDESILKRIPNRMYGVRIVWKEIDAFFQELYNISIYIADLHNMELISTETRDYILHELQQIYDNVRHWLLLKSMPSKVRAQKTIYLEWVSRRYFSWLRPVVSAALTLTTEQHI